MAEDFTVIWRNPGHWDIGTLKGRAFAIRGGPGKYYIRDERPDKNRSEMREFKTVEACMAYICDELMFEHIVAKGQKPITIESWNVV